jgi:thiol-disulfide isomerase/thioredoxin
MRSLTLASGAVLLVISMSMASEPSGQSKTENLAQPPQGSIASQFAKLVAELEKEQSARAEILKKAQRGGQKGAVVGLPRIDLIADYARRAVDLAETSPADPAARDVLLWVIHHPGRSDTGPYGDQFARAAALLARHHGDDPEAVRIGLRLDNIQTPRREALLFGFFVTAKGREAKGLARLALAQYLDEKAQAVEHARSVEGRPKVRIMSGGKVEREIDLTDQQYAEHLSLRQCDPQVIRAEAERLFEEVIADYADVPHITHGRRLLERVMKDPAPKQNGKPLTEQDRRSVESLLARRRTLGEEAEARLDAIFNLAVGKPAPEIEGVDIDGKSFKLSDFRGKVVALVFWGSWCGPCMAMVPHERELVERLKDEPFALIGVDCEGDKETARRTMAREHMTWPSWFDGPAGTGPIATRYHIRGYPAVFIIDANGIIRNRGGIFDEPVDKLLKEMKQTAAKKEPALAPADETAKKN